MMLHILLVVLKIIGIIVAVILGILVLLLLVVLFVPVRYRVSGNGEGKLDSFRFRADVNWLLSLFSASFLYENRTASQNVRIFWKRMLPEESEERNRKQEDAAEASYVKEEVSVPKKDANVPKEDTAAPREEAVEGQHASSASSDKTEKHRKRESIHRGKTFFAKIKYTIQKICATIKLMAERKEKISAFIGDEMHRNAFGKAKQELFRLASILKPKKIRVHVRFGFEDPYYTGKTLAFLGMIYPFLGDNTTIIPDFEEKVFDGTFAIKGHIRSCHLVMTVLRLLIDKNIRTTYKQIRRFKF